MQVKNVKQPHTLNISENQRCQTVSPLPYTEVKQFSNSASKKLCSFACAPQGGLLHPKIQRRKTSSPRHVRDVKHPLLGMSKMWKISPQHVKYVKHSLLGMSKTWKFSLRHVKDVKVCPLHVNGVKSLSYARQKHRSASPLYVKDIKHFHPARSNCEKLSLIRICSKEKVELIKTEFLQQMETVTTIDKKQWPSRASGQTSSPTCQLLLSHNVRGQISQRQCCWWNCLCPTVMET